MSLCNFCSRIALPRSPGDSDRSWSLLNQPSIWALIKSADVCSVCRFLLDLFEEEHIREAVEAASNGEYTQIRITTLDKPGDPNQLLENVAYKSVEISSKGRVWARSSQVFILYR
jgi:hypothetical protein